MTTPFLYHQVYKNRAEALEKLIHAKGWPLSQGKFYPDMLKEGLIQPDKSLHLADLLNYIERKVKIDPVTGRSLVATDHDEEMRKMDREEKKLKIDKLKRDERKDDRDYMKRETAEEREGALVGSILNELRYQLGKVVPALITIGKADPARKADISQMLDETIFAAFRTLYENPEIDLTFEDETE